MGALRTVISQESDDDGFTLIEVLIAFVILSIGLTVLLGTYSTAVKRARLTESGTIAAAHAQSLLAEAGVTRPIAEGESVGTFNDGFDWKVNILPYGTGDDASTWPKGAYSVTVTVSLADVGHTQSLALTSLRLGTSTP